MLPEADFEDFAEKDEPFTGSLLQEAAPEEEALPRRKFVSKHTLQSILQKRREREKEE